VDASKRFPGGAPSRQPSSSSTLRITHLFMAVMWLAPMSLAFAPAPTHLAAGTATPMLSSHRRAAALMQGSQGPLEEGFKEILPFATEEGNVDPELVDRVDEEVFALMGVGLDDLLNPSKVVNYEREKILLTQQIGECEDAAERGELQQRLTKVEKQLYSEKRTVFSGWLKALFVGQALIAIALGGVAAFDAFPTVTIDISLQALGFWSFWLFIIPSLRARRPRGWEKIALNYAFLGSPILTIGMPFVARDPGLIWSANLALLVTCYALGFAFARGDDVQAGGFSGALSALDFGSGQERGIRGKARERYFDKLNDKAEAEPGSAEEREPVLSGDEAQRK